MRAPKRGALAWDPGKLSGKAGRPPSLGDGRGFEPAHQLTGGGGTVGQPEFAVPLVEGNEQALALVAGQPGGGTAARGEGIDGDLTLAGEQVI